jgi:omega-amidase
MKNLKLTIIQSKIFWEDTKRNLDMFDKKIDAVKESTNLIILPEMFTTGFSMNPEKSAQDMNGVALDWMRRKANEKDCDIMGSVKIKEGEKFFNRLICVKPDGKILKYDKKHLFRMLGEEKVYTAGESRVAIDLNGWKISPFICYDLRFPVWSRNLNNEYDIAVYTANWPAIRSHHWKTLLKARAIENQCYVVGVNRTGYDGNDIYYSGDSRIINPAGETIFGASDEECSHTAELSYQALKEYRTTFPVWMDADRR